MEICGGAFQEKGTVSEKGNQRHPAPSVGLCVSHPVHRGSATTWFVVVVVVSGRAAGRISVPRPGIEPDPQR